MTTITHHQATHGQKKQISRLGSDAIEKIIEELDLDGTGSQRVIEHGDEFATVIREAVRSSLLSLSISDRLNNEEVRSKYGYKSGYKPRTIPAQVAILRQFFPELGSIDEGVADSALPRYAEGWFAIPRWQRVAPTYNQAVEKVLDAIRQSIGQLRNWRDQQTGPEYLRQTRKTEFVFQNLELEQRLHDILVIASQFGIRHRGRSVHRAREVFQTNEFGLGAFAAGIMLLTHPERLQHDDDLWVECAGDEYNDPTLNIPFDRAPYFGFSKSRTEFGRSWFCAQGQYGSASGFLSLK